MTTTIEHALHTFMAQVTTEMGSEYRRIYARSIEDPGTAGDEGEENWASLLREWLPPNYHVATKGRLIGPNGDMSPQIDVLVLKPFYPAKLREKRVWLAGGVAAAFECKTTIKTNHIVGSITRCRQFKSLFARQTGTPQKELRSSLIYGILAHSHPWKSAGSKPVENVNSALEEAIKSVDHPSNLIDMICISDLGNWSLFSAPYYEASWQPDNLTCLQSVFGGSWGAATSMMCATAGDKQEVGFQPIGSAISYLTQRFAWQDSTLRDLADYYRLASLLGNARGQSQFWPQSIYSENVRNQISNGRLDNGEPWSEWNAGLI